MEMLLASSPVLTIHFSSSARPDFTYSPFENVQHSRRRSKLQRERRVNKSLKINFISNKKNGIAVNTCLLKSDILMKEKTCVISLRMKNEGT